jgi:hypothetical protein
MHSPRKGIVVTVKDELHALVDALSDEDAADLLEQFRRQARTPATNHSIDEMVSEGGPPARPEAEKISNETKQ